MACHRTFYNSLLSCVIFLYGLSLSNSINVPKVNRNCNYSKEVYKRVYDFTLLDVMEARNVSLREHRNKILLITNVASFCGFTWQYPKLNALKEKYGPMGFEILGFPSNQFLLQEPGRNGEEILNGIKYVRPGNGFVPNFPIFTKINVNGENEHPLYTYLKSLCPPVSDEFRKQTMLFYSPMKNSDVRWNFEKFLIDRNGLPVKRYNSPTEPDELSSDIEALLDKQISYDLM